MNDSFKIGRIAEAKFANFAVARGYSYKYASKEEDINEHWDIKLYKDNTEIKVDVKAMKKLQRHDNSVQDDWVWIELHSVRQNNKGWL